MSQTPFNRIIYQQRLKRIELQGYDDFLLKHAERECQDRLSLINRQFATAKSFTPYDAAINIDESQTNPETVELVTSLLTLQFNNDVQGILRQQKAQLKPDGFFICAMIGGESLNELHTALSTAESEITGGVSPHIHPMIDVKTAGALLSHAGFALPVVDNEILTLRYDNAIDLMHDLRKMGATNILNARSKNFLRRDVLKRASDIYRQQFSDLDGRIRATFEILWLTGWQPHESQQKPLKRGSATHKLADFL